MMSMGVVDTLMVGRLVGAGRLAAVALGNLYFFLIGVFGMGTLMVLDPVVAQAVGARDHAVAARGVQRGILLAGLLALPASPSCSSSPSPFMRLAPTSRRRSSRSPRPTPIRLAPGRAAVLPLHRAAAEPPVHAGDASHRGGDRRRQPGQRGAQLDAHLRPWRRARAMGVAGSAWATTISRWLLAGRARRLAWRRARPAAVPDPSGGVADGAARPDAPARPSDRLPSTCSSSALSPSWR